MNTATKCLEPCSACDGCIEASQHDLSTRIAELEGVAGNAAEVQGNQMREISRLEAELGWQTQEAKDNRALYEDSDTDLGKAGQRIAKLEAEVARLERTTVPIDKYNGVVAILGRSKARADRLQAALEWHVGNWRTVGGWVARNMLDAEAVAAMSELSIKHALTPPPAEPSDD